MKKFTAHFMRDLINRVPYSTTIGNIAAENAEDAKNKAQEAMLTLPDISEEVMSMVDEAVNVLPLSLDDNERCSHGEPDVNVGPPEVVHVEDEADIKELKDKDKPPSRRPVDFTVTRDDTNQALVVEPIRSMCTGHGDRFGLGNIWLTTGLRARKIDWIELIRRHTTGDFGDFGKLDDITVTDEEIEGGVFVTDDEKKHNKIAIIKGRGRIMSVYGDIWIITESNGTDVETNVMQSLRITFLRDLSQYTQQELIFPTRQETTAVDAFPFAILHRLE